MATRRPKFPLSRRAARVMPALLGSVVTGYLAVGALAILRELARRAWESCELTEAGGGANGQPPHGPLPVRHVLLLDQRAADLRREYLATSPPSIVRALCDVRAEPRPWKDALLAMLDAMPPTGAAGTAVVVADAQSERGMHEAGRVARLHPGIPVFVQTSEGPGTSGAISGLLHPFQRALLVGGALPEDTWTRVARQWHECYRLNHPPASGNPPTPAGRPWDSLDDFFRQDTVLQIRSIMTAVVACGRRWVPGRAVAPGSFIELGEPDLEAVARAEHTRWYRRRLGAGWSPVPHPDARHPHQNSPVSSRMAPWAELPPAERCRAIDDLRAQLAQLEEVGFMPIVPPGGPPGTAEFRRTGTVRARRLHARRPWTRRSGDELQGNAGDWRVVDDAGDERTVRDLVFRDTYAPLGGEVWQRTGTFLAWQARETLVLRTMEGRAMAQPGDWVVEGSRGERWPVTDSQFRRTYASATPDT